MRSARIMIVDDEPDIVKAVGMRLRSAGYDILAAADGLTATQCAVQEKPDLIILDIGLPAGDGHTVARRLRDNLKTFSTPVIYLTARNSQEDLRKAAAVGAAGYLVKPFRTEDLLGVVARVLRESGVVGN